MTIRAWITGLVLALALGWFGFYNDGYVRATFIVGNHLPASVFGVLILAILLVNPLLRLTRLAKPFRGSELAVILALMSAVCVVPGSGLLRTFAPVLVMPHHWEKQASTWTENEVLSYVPEHVLVDTGEDEERVVEAFVDGLRRPNRPYSVEYVPWDAWLPTLSLWVPLFFLIMLATIGMAVILHRQWSTYEHLSYPIAQFSNFIFGSEVEKGSGPRSIVGNKLFWYGFLPVFLIYVNNGINAYEPKWPRIPVNVTMWPLGALWPEMTVQEGSYGVFDPTLHFTVIAFAYFLPGEVTLSLGISLLCSVVMGAIAMEHGFRLSRSFAGAGNIQGFQFGAYVGMALMIFYTGRNYFRRVFAEASGFGVVWGLLQRHVFRPVWQFIRRRVLRRPATAGSEEKVSGEKIESSSIWGFRVLLVCSAASTWLMTQMGLAWPVALAVMGMILIMYAVLARISAETGLFFLQPWWQPGGVLLGLLGAVFLGPTMLIVAVIISLILTIDPREALIPYMINAFRVCEDHAIPRGRIALASAIVLGVAVVGAVFVSLVLEYNDGAPQDGWGVDWVPKMAPDLVSKEVETMQREGTLEAAKEMGIWERFGHIKPDREFCTTTIIGLLLFMGCASGRLRFSWWPIHPVIFLVWLTYPMHQFSFSFLLGWMVKTTVVNFGGAGTYQRYKPAAVGVIAGSILAALLFMVIAAIYYLHYNYPAPGYRIFPG